MIIFFVDVRAKCHDCIHSLSNIREITMKYELESFRNITFEHSFNGDQKRTQVFL